jgi:hypothetical protein
MQAFIISQGVPWRSYVLKGEADVRVLWEEKPSPSVSWEAHRCYRGYRAPNSWGTLWTGDGQWSWRVQGYISSKRVQELEPNVWALQALHSPHTGITDYATGGRSFAENFLSTGRVVKSTQGQLPSPFSWLIDSPEEFICSSFHNLCNLHLNCDLLRKVGSSQLWE